VVRDSVSIPRRIARSMRIRQMSTDLLNPVSDECEAATRVTAGKVGDPARKIGLIAAISPLAAESSATETVIEFAQ
jgi:hypothetical protein